MNNNIQQSEKNEKSSRSICTTCGECVAGEDHDLTAVHQLAVARMSAYIADVLRLCPWCKTKQRRPKQLSACRVSSHAFTLAHMRQLPLVVPKYERRRGEKVHLKLVTNLGVIGR